jgi:NADH-quinone oxidoreductase subunit F
VANPVLTPDHFDAPVSYEGMAAAGSGIGSVGFVFYDDSACIVEVARALSRFLYVESCGQCRSCKYGTGEITRSLEAIGSGEGTEQHVEVIGARLLTVTDQTRCFLAAEEQIMISSILREFPEEFALHLEGRCSVAEPRRIEAPKLVDVADGVATYDERQARKHPDWTYDDA